MKRQFVTLTDSKREGHATQKGATRESTRVPQAAEGAREKHGQ